MARPSKSVNTLNEEGKSHRTKAELESRKAAEESMLSGEPLFERQEVRTDKVAHKEFLRLSKIMKRIGKSDALYSPGINLHCQLYSEISRLEEEVLKISDLAEKLEETFSGIDNVTFEQVEKFSRQLTKLISQKNSVRSLIDRKRSLMFAIDKENVMTVSSALRSIPKNPEKKKNPLLDALNDDDEK